MTTDLARNDFTDFSVKSVATDLRAHPETAGPF